MPVPAGLAYVAGSVSFGPINQTTGFQGTIANNPPTVSTSGSDVIFSIGDVTNSSAPSTVFLFYELQAQPGATGTPQISGTLVDSRTVANGFINGAPAFPTTLDMNIVVPVLTLTKTFSQSNGQAGNNLTATLTIKNTGTGPAYNVALQDLVSSSFGATFVANAVFTGSQAPQGSGTLVQFTNGTLLAGQTASAVIDLTIAGNVNAGSTLSNTATATAASAPTGGVAEVIEQASATLSVAQPSVKQILLKTSAAEIAAPDVTIGEDAFFEFQVTVPAGQTPGLVLTDQLPPGLTYVGFTIDTTSFNGSVPAPQVTASTTPGGTATFDFGSAGNVTSPSGSGGSTFNLIVEAQVANVPTNTGLPPNQSVLTNGGQLKDSNGSPLTINTVSVTVVEPKIVVTPNQVAPPKDGGTIFSFHVANVGTSPAHTIVVTIPFEDAQFDPTKVTTVNLPPGYTLTVVSGPGTGQHSVVFTGGPGVELLPGQSTDFGFELIPVGQASSVQLTVETTVSTLQGGTGTTGQRTDSANAVETVTAKPAQPPQGQATLIQGGDVSGAKIGCEVSPSGDSSPLALAPLGLLIFGLVLRRTPRALSLTKGTNA